MQRSNVKALEDGEAARLSALGVRVSELESEVAALNRELRLMRIANGELERVALRDTLTPLYNRRYFVNALNERIARMRRHGGSTALILCDIDTMKVINDTLGHGAGDYALIHIAQLLQRGIRAIDVAARIGGDEFALIMDAIEEPAARAKVHDLTRLVTDTPCVFDGQRLCLSASFGFTMLDLSDSEDTAMRRADTQMYACKREHRDGATAQPSSR